MSDSHRGPHGPTAPSRPITSKGFGPLLDLIRSARPPYALMALALVFSLITTAAGLVVPLFTKSLVDGFSVQSLDAGTIAMIVGAFLLQAVGGALAGYALYYAGLKVVASVRSRLWEQYLRLPVSTFDLQPPGELASRMTNDTAVLQNLVGDQFPGFVTGVLSALVGVGFLFWLDWQMSLVMLGAIPVVVAIMVPLGRIRWKTALEIQGETARLSGLLGQVLSEVRLVKASGAEAKERVRGQGAIADLFRLGRREGKVQSVLQPIMGLVMMTLLVIIVGYGGLRVSSGALTAGGLVAFILYLIQVVMPATQVAQFFNQVQKARGATDSLLELLNSEPEPAGIGLLPGVGAQPVRFEGVSFGYADDRRVLHDLSFTLEPGTVTAIVGPSGGGKTTLFSLLERFYQPQQGEIFWGEQKLTELDLAAWRSLIGYVPQDSPLLAGTIRGNIAYGLDREVSDDEIREAARAANAADFIEGLELGYETEVGERGVKLSGGQRQRLAIARALLRNPQLLMLDEATASLDAGSERAVQEALETLMRGRTTLIIAHRLSTVVGADRILFLEGGRVTGSGRHDELVASHELYRSFAEHQLRWKTMSRLLVVDDDPHILELVAHFLAGEGHEVVTATTGHGALEAAARSQPDLVVLDVLLPGVDGREVCRRLRRQGEVPVLMLTALGQLHHKLQGFDAGADDYLAKPFEPSELVARVRALLKRSSRSEPRAEGMVRAGGLNLDPASLTVNADGVRHDLPALEFHLLENLARSPGRLFSRDQLLAAVWGADFQGTDRTIDVYVNRLRTRFPEATHGYRIVAVRGVGYRLEVAS